MNREKQEEWKRTQLRMPPDQYELVTDYANTKGLSLNSAILELIDVAIDIVDRGQLPANIKVFHLSNGIKRVIYGKLANAFELDYKNPNLTELKYDIQDSLTLLSSSGKLKDRFMFLNKNVLVYQGDNHIDVVDDSVGSLNWIVVEDHITEKYMEQLHSDE